MFSFRMTSGSAVAVAGVCAVLFPLTDPLLASAWRPLVEVRRVPRGGEVDKSEQGGEKGSCRPGAWADLWL